MRKAWVVVLALAAVSSQTVAGQDAKTVIGNASKAMGVEGLNSIYYYGVAQNGNLGQNNNSNQPWPMAGANDYVRAIDFTQHASRATWMNYAVPVTGGVATLTPGQQNINAQSPWAQQVEIYITPWGFLKGAAGNNATVKAQTVGGKRYQVVSVTGTAKSPSGQPYKVVGYINSQNLVEKVQNWLENPIFGDMLVEAEYTHYRDGANGLKFPEQMVQKRGGWPTFTAYILGAHANPANLQQLLAAPPGGRGGGGARAGGDCRGQTGDSEQTDPLRRHLAPPLRSHQRPAGRGRGGHHDCHAGGQPRIPDDYALGAANTRAGLHVEVREEAGDRRLQGR